MQNSRTAETLSVFIYEILAFQKSKCSFVLKSKLPPHLAYPPTVYQMQAGDSDSRSTKAVLTCCLIRNNKMIEFQLSQ